MMDILGATTSNLQMMGLERSETWFRPGFGLLLIWTIIWKGLALWKSARNDQRYWFVALLITNTLGILELLYLFVFAKNKLVLVSEPPTSKAKPASKRKAK
jgi:hypothetical protein